MFLDKISPSDSFGNEINVIVEISRQSGPIKYEIDKDTNALKVDRFTQAAMHYPCDYGFIPNTLGGDGDPVDVLVISNYPIIPGAIIACRPIGVLLMEDDGGEDEKIIAVPTSKLDITFDNINSVDDLDKVLKHRIVHFFEHYKDLEPGKWVKVGPWGSLEQAKSIIMIAIQKAKNNV